MIHEKIHHLGGICQTLYVNDSVHSHALEVMEKVTLETRQVYFLFHKLGVQTLAWLMEARVIKHGMDLRGLVGVGCADQQVSPVSIRWSSYPGCKGVRLDLHYATHDGFVGWKTVCLGEVLVVEPELVHGIFTPQQSTGLVISVGHWLASMGTGSS